MKKAVLTSILCFLFGEASAQSKANICGNGCYDIITVTKADEWCGGKNDYKFTVTNSTDYNVDVTMFAQRTNGEWHSLGLANNIKAGQRDVFHQCNSTGKSVVYFRKSGSKDRFPNASEVGAAAIK